MVYFSCYRHLELKPWGTLAFGTLDANLIQAKELEDEDVIGKYEPFILIFVWRWDEIGNKIVRHYTSFWLCVL